MKPCAELLPSYPEAIQEGTYCNRALGFGDASLSEILRDTDVYLSNIKDPQLWKVKLPNGSEFTITDHELFWSTDGHRFIGSVALRYRDDLELFENYCGHAGLAIRPSLLNKGYGVKALIAALESGRKIAKEKGLDSILVSCDQKNIASKRIIEHAGGKLFRRNDDFCGTAPNLIYQIFL